MAADPILLPDCPELRARAEAIARARYDREVVAMGSNEALHTTPAWYQRGLTEAALSDLRDLSTPTGRDHACRWLWALLTGEEPEWCPGWNRYDPLGYVLSQSWRTDDRITIGTPMPGDPFGYDPRHRELSVDGAHNMSPTEALAAAITAALDWRRGVSNG